VLISPPSTLRRRTADLTTPTMPTPSSTRHQILQASRLSNPRHLLQPPLVLRTNPYLHQRYPSPSGDKFLPEGSPPTAAKHNFTPTLPPEEPPSLVGSPTPIMFLVAAVASTHGVLVMCGSSALTFQGVTLRELTWMKRHGLRRLVLGSDALHAVMPAYGRSALVSR